jgi:uncharacterized protein YciI
MFIAFLKFSKNKHQAADLLARHNEWIKSGLADGVFLLVGSLQPGLGGAIVAHNTTREELEVRLEDDPFVARDVVTVELFEVSPAKSDPRLAFLVV